MKKNKKIYHLHNDQMFGTTVIGSKGQIVIPSEARQMLKIKTGDRLVVMGKHGKILALFKVDEFKSLFTMMMKAISQKPSKSMLDEVHKAFRKTINHK